MCFSAASGCWHHHLLFVQEEDEKLPTIDDVLPAENVGGDELLEDGEAFNIIVMVVAVMVEGKFSISWLSSIVMENEMNLVLLFGGPRGRLLLKLLQLEWL